MNALSMEEVEIVTGGACNAAYYNFGYYASEAYWAARNYLSGTVYPYWFG